jgi:hypothetical protein
VDCAEGLNSQLSYFWPARSPVWDAFGSVGPKVPIFLEAKAHIPEAASPGTKASPLSLGLIRQSLSSARRYSAPRSRADWSGLFNQYANRLAHQYFLRQLNGIRSRLVFLYFVNANDMAGPTSEAEWHGAVRLLHAALGLPKNLSRFGVFDAFVDARLLHDAV